MTIIELPLDNRTSIAQFLPTSTNISFGATCKEMNGWWNAFFFNNPEKVSRFAQNFLQFCLNESEAEEGLERFLQTPCKTPYSLTVDCLEYNDEVVQIVAKALPNLTHCKYVRPHYLLQHTPDLSIHETAVKVCAFLETFCCIAVAIPLSTWHYNFEALEEQTYCTDSLKKLAKRGIPARLRFTDHHEDYRLNTLFSAFGTISELDVVISPEREQHPSLERWCPDFMLPKNTLIKKLSVQPHSETTINCHLRFDGISFVHLKQLSSLSIHDMDLVLPSYSTFPIQEPIQEMVDENIPPQLEELSFHKMKR